MIVDIARLRAGHERVVADADVARPHHGEHVGGDGGVVHVAGYAAASQEPQGQTSCLYLPELNSRVPTLVLSLPDCPMPL